MQFIEKTHHNKKNKIYKLKDRKNFPLPYNDLEKSVVGKKILSNIIIIASVRLEIDTAYMDINFTKDEFENNEVKPYYLYDDLGQQVEYGKEVYLTWDDWQRALAYHKDYQAFKITHFFKEKMVTLLKDRIYQTLHGINWGEVDPFRVNLFETKHSGGKMVGKKHDHGTKAVMRVDKDFQPLYAYLYKKVGNEVNDPTVQNWYKERGEHLNMYMEALKFMYGLYKACHNKFFITDNLLNKVVKNAVSMTQTKSMNDPAYGLLLVKALDDSKWSYRNYSNTSTEWETDILVALQNPAFEHIKYPKGVLGYEAYEEVRRSENHYLSMFD